jgi:hypothetical protein
MLCHPQTPEIPKISVHPREFLVVVPLFRQLTHK